MLNNIRPVPQIQRQNLDREYLQLRQVICNSDFYRSTSRHIRIRFNLWSKKLDQIVSDVSWKRNRNNYIKLMYLMAQTRIIVDLFLSLPPEHDLPILKNYQITAIIDLVDSKINEKIAKNGFCKVCLMEEKQGKLPYRLNTNRSLNLKTQECNNCENRASVYLPSSKITYAKRYESKATIEVASQGYNYTEQEQMAFFQDKQKENSNQQANLKTFQQVKTGQDKHFCQKMSGLDISNDINEAKMDRTDIQAECDERVDIPLVRKFHTFLSKQAIR